MKIFDDINKLSSLYAGAVVTIGTFDGIHCGHKIVIQSLLDIAKQNKIPSGLVTFWPHPLEIIAPKYAPPLLLTKAERLELLENFNLDFILLINFNRTIADWSADYFVEHILVDKLKIKHLIIGYDHGFGKNRDGNIGLLRTLGRKYNFNVEQLSHCQVQRQNVSSTCIRRLLLEGKVALANIMLGRTYNLTGKVIKGEGRGRQLNFPTANLDILNSHKLIPKMGVYVVKVKGKVFEDKEYFGVMNLGLRPTYEESGLFIEVHILDFNQDIYDEILKVELIEYLRGEYKFSSPEKLKEQIRKDIIKAREILRIDNG